MKTFFFPFILNTAMKKTFFFHFDYSNNLHKQSTKLNDFISSFFADGSDEKAR